MIFKHNHCDSELSIVTTQSINDVEKTIVDAKLFKQPEAGAVMHYLLRDGENWKQSLYISVNNEKMTVINVHTRYSTEFQNQDKIDVVRKIHDLENDILALVNFIEIKG